MSPWKNVRRTATATLTAALTAGLMVAAPQVAAAATPEKCSWTGPITVKELPSVHVIVMFPLTWNGDWECYLNEGSRGDGVKTLQKAINKCYGTNLVVDGIFGAATKSAVRAVQKKEGITVDGVYGVQTRRYMKWPVDNFPTWACYDELK